MKKQNYFELEEIGELKEANSKHHTTITKGTNYK
jgi:hypothetical protein